jgi:hypothetical protein
MSSGQLPENFHAVVLFSGSLRTALKEKNITFLLHFLLLPQLIPARWRRNFSWQLFMI